LFLADKMVEEKFYFTLNPQYIDIPIDMSILVNDIDVSRNEIIKKITLTHRSRMLSRCMNFRLYTENIEHQESAEHL